jgi:hypothetical protein
MNWYSQERKIVEKWVCLFSQMEIYRTKQKQKQEKKSNTSNVLAIINATVNGAESATGYDALDDELGGVNLPLVPGDSGRCFLFLFSVLVLLHSPCPAQMPLKLLVQALQIYLIRPHIPTTTFTRLFRLPLSLSLSLSFPDSQTLLIVSKRNR